MRNSFVGSFFFVVVLLVAFSSFGFAATCTTWSLGNTTTTIAPGGSAGAAVGTPSPGDPCTLGVDTFSNFTVFNGAVSNSDIAVGVAFAVPAVLNFTVANLTSVTDFDVVYDVSPFQSTITVSDTMATGMIDFTVCSHQVLIGQSCAGQGGTVLGMGMVGGSSSTTVILAASTTGGSTWLIEDVSGTTSFSNSFTTPEPVTFSLMGLGLMAVGFAGRKRLRKD